MNGGTSFNSDMFRAEHLMIEDGAASKDIRTRNKMAAAIKQITANEGLKCYPKHGKAFYPLSFWEVNCVGK